MCPIAGALRTCFRLRNGRQGRTGLNPEVVVSLTPMYTCGTCSLHHEAPDTSFEEMRAVSWCSRPMLRPFSIASLGVHSVVTGNACVLPSIVAEAVPYDIGAFILVFSFDFLYR